VPTIVWSSIASINPDPRAVFRAVSPRLTVAGRSHVLTHTTLGRQPPATTIRAGKPAWQVLGNFDESLGNAWHASHSQIYPELAKLEAEGMVEVIAQGARKSKTWALTDAGREELRRWLVEVEPSRQQRSESALRMFLTPRLLSPEDARFALERDLQAVLAQQQQLEDIKNAIEAGGVSSPFEPAVDLGLRMNPVMESWLRDQLAELEGKD
jgi:PadR family transcriptional regulator AphA